MFHIGNWTLTPNNTYMKQKTIFAIMAAVACHVSMAQSTLENYNATHRDSSWYFSFEYDSPKMKSDDGMIVVTHLCTPDTCISSAVRHIQGKRYSKKYAKRHGTLPQANRGGHHSCTLAIPEESICDTVYGITYCEYDGKKGVEYICDTVTICMQKAPPMSCHMVEPAQSIADHMASEHPYIRNIRYYTPLTGGNTADVGTMPNIVRYKTNSNKLDPEYLQNAKNIDELLSIIEDVLKDSTTTIEALQFIGYTSPDGLESGSTGLGYARAMAIRDHIRKQHQLPDSIFEIADGNKNWNMIYADIRELGNIGYDTIITQLMREPNPKKRESILKKYNGGVLYRELSERMFPAHRMACCTGIYYSKKTDSIAIKLNEIANELANNPAPDYARLIHELQHYKNDPRVLNMQGVMEYRRHHRHAAEQAFAKAAILGDSQALTNLQIVEANKNREK